MSTAAWEADRALTSELATSTIRELFPTVDTSELRPLGSGWEFDVYAIPRLAEILSARGEKDVSRTFAASALGRMHDPAVTHVLGRAVLDKSAMARRQIGHALRRTGHADAVPHLLRLADDPEKHVSDVARASLSVFKKQLGPRLTKGRRPVAKKKRRGVSPSRDD